MGQLQEVLQIPVTAEDILIWRRLMVVPGNVRLDGIQSGHVHLEQAVFPVHSGDPVVMDAARDVAELFPILPEAVILVVYAEGTVTGRPKCTCNERTQKEGSHSEDKHLFSRGQPAARKIGGTMPRLSTTFCDARSQEGCGSQLTIMTVITKFQPL